MRLLLLTFLQHMLTHSTASPTSFSKAPENLPDLPLVEASPESEKAPGVLPGDDAEEAEAEEEEEEDASVAEAVALNVLLLLLPRMLPPTARPLLLLLLSLLLLVLVLELEASCSSEKSAESCCVLGSRSSHSSTCRTHLYLASHSMANWSATVSSTPSMKAGM
jgi:hypothetical protein